jgi:superfamily II DNA or RNA helicase
MTTFAAGSIVRVRDREWIVQPGSTAPVYTLAPLGSTSDETTVVHALLEPLESASFAPPDPERRGDANSCRLLRDAARLATRHAAGPYRSFARLGFQPRPYQLVPLIMALRLDPVRLLIADDVGIGKTIEALLIARELFDRREIRGFSVLCPPHLAEQWQRELRDKFHIEAELVLASTTQQLERRISGTQTIFSRFPFTVVSLDYVKSPRRSREFLQTCPDLVIVDEAHTCTPSGGGRGATRQMRHDLLKGLAAKPGQHMILTTATPHSGNADAYDALLGLLDERFLPDGELGRDCSDQKARDKELARRFVQRRRPDIVEYLGDTRFPERVETTERYELSPAMQALIEDVAGFANRYRSAKASTQVQRTRAWAILTLFQAMASSPAAAAATLANRSGDGDDRAGTADAGLFEHAAEGFARPLLDDFLDDSDASDGIPSVGAFEREVATEEGPEGMNREARQFFASLEARAAAIPAEDDTKLLRLERFLKKHLADASNADGGVVVFCRFIATAEYLARELGQSLGKKALVEVVVGSLPDSERKARIDAMTAATGSDGRARVLVATDCLSEGINLQDAFDTVVHYDLSWNPNRHVQREGRVDRFGQVREKVHITFFHSDETVFDPIVMNVLHRRRSEIARELGYLVSVPLSRDAILGLILERAADSKRIDRTGFLFSAAELERCRSEVADFDRECTEMVKSERALRLRFNQHQLKPDEVALEMERVQAAIGSDSVARFVTDCLRRGGLVVDDKQRHVLVKHQSDATPAVGELVDATLSPNRGAAQEYRLRFDGPAKHATHVTRAHPLVESLASHVLQASLDPRLDGGGVGKRPPIAARCGLVQTEAVTKRTTVLLLRNRYEIEAEQRGSDEREPMLAEDVFAVALEGELASATRLADERAAELIDVLPSANFDADRAQRLLTAAVDAMPGLTELLAGIAVERAKALAASHDATRSGRKPKQPTKAVPTGTPDILGLFVLMPHSPNGGAR